MPLMSHSPFEVDKGQGHNIEPLYGFFVAALPHVMLSNYKGLHETLKGKRPF
jgi:hypothetical protein